MKDHIAIAYDSLGKNVECFQSTDNITVHKFYSQKWVYLVAQDDTAAIPVKPFCGQDSSTSAACRYLRIRTIVAATV